MKSKKPILIHTGLRTMIDLSYNYQAQRGFHLKPMKLLYIHYCPMQLVATDIVGPFPESTSERELVCSSGSGLFHPLGGSLLDCMSRSCSSGEKARG